MTAKVYDFTALIEGREVTHKVRVVALDGNPWFMAADACRVLEMDTSKGVHRHLGSIPEGEKRTVRFDEIDPRLVRGSTGRGGARGSSPVTVLSKKGLVRLIMRSDKPIAQPFQDWALDVIIEVMETGERKARPGETIPVPADYAEALRLGAEMMIKLAEEQEAHAKTEAERQAALAEKARAEAEVARLEPVAATVGVFEHTVFQTARLFEGVNATQIKRDLERAGYLYLSSGGRYRVYHRFRKTHFKERHHPQYGSVDIFATAKGKEVIGKLHRDGRLTMLKGHEKVAVGQ